jgi:multidrug resistance efflux pump
MTIALVITALYVGLAYLVFVRFKWLKFSITWGVICALTGMHVVLVFIIGMHFMTPCSTDARVIQHTIQLVPRLPEPTLVTAVLVKPNTAVKKGQPLFQFDRTPYEHKVKEQQAALAEARQNVLGLDNDVTTAQAVVARAKAQRSALDAQHGILKSNLGLAEVNLVKAQASRDYAKLQYERYQTLAKIDAEAVETFEKWDYDLREKEGTVTEAATSIEKARLQLTLWASDVVGADAAVREAQDDVRKAQLAATSTIDGVNTTVARLEAQLAQAQYYLDNTTMVAPVDGMIVNLQVEPGMVAGIVRFGAIAALIVDADRYVLGTYYQEQLKYVKPGMRVETAIDLYPGQIFTGKVESIWWGSGAGQLVPSGDLPSFDPPPVVPQGRFAVAIRLDDPDQSKFPIGARGASAIYTTDGAWAALRKISIRTYTWLNWLYPMSL